MEDSDSDIYNVSQASEVARVRSKFNVWSHDAKLIRIDQRENPQTIELYDYLSEIKFPKDAIQFLETAQQRDESLVNETQLASDLLTWVRGHPESIASEEEDVCDIKKLFNNTLVFAFVHACGSTAWNKETAQRRTIDILIDAAFSKEIRKGAKAEVDVEAGIRLRSTSLNVRDAIADTLVIHNFLDIEGWVRLYQMVGAAEVALNDEGEPLTSYDYTLEVTAGTTPTKIILFAMEAKRHESVTNCNQLCFDLCTAQSQRRALGLKDDVIFGGVFADEKFSIYSSFWYLSKTYVEHQGEFNLRNAIGFIGCWIFLRRLHDHACKNAEEDSRTFDMEKAILSMRKNQWRAEKKEWRVKNKVETRETLSERVTHWMASIDDPNPL